MPEFDLIHVGEDGRISTSMRCTSCNLCKEPELVTNCMSGTGIPGSTYMMVGHQPGREDDRIGQAFTGKNGRLLRQLLEEAEFDLSDIYFTNALKCCLYDSKPKDSYWKKCQHHFRQELEEVKPQAIVSFGNTALKWLTGFSGVRRFARRGLPCVFDPEIVVYPFEQAITIDHYKGREFYKARAKFIKNLMWLKQKEIDGTLHQTDDIPTDYKMAQTVDDVREFLAEFPKGSLVYGDAETATEGFDMATFPYPGNRIVAMGFSKGPGHARTIPLEARGAVKLTYWTDDELAEINAMLREFFLTHKTTGHNWAQFDHKWVSVRYDIDELEIPFESMLASHLMDEEPGGHGLETLALRYSKMMPWKKTFTVKDIKRCCDYLAKDVDGGYRVYQALNAKISPKLRWLHENIQLPLALEARRMEQRGVAIDVEAMEELGSTLRKVMEESEKEFRTDDRVKAWELKNGPIGFDNPHHMRDLMENYFKLECIKKTESGLYSADAEVLEYWEDDVPVLQPYLRRRRASKLYGTYYSGVKTRVEEHGPIIHYSMKIHGTVTGRPSFANPNVGNIPRPDTAHKAGIDDPKIVKSMFCARPGRVLLQIDYKQAESRMLAILSDDKNLKQVFYDGQDIHSATAATVYGIPIDEFMQRLKSGDTEVKGYRSDAKVINFGIPYGKSEESLVNDFVIAARLSERKAAKKAGREPDFTADMEKDAEEKGKRFLRLHKENYPEVWVWLSKQEKLIRTKGYLETPFGRRRRFWKIDNAAIRQAYNFPIQSTASELTHISLVRCAKILRELEIDAYPILTVYDSIVFECTPENMWEVADIASDIMETLDQDYPWITVPMKVDAEAGPSWGRLKELDVENRRFAA